MPRTSLASAAAVLALTIVIALPTAVTATPVFGTSGGLSTSVVSGTVADEKNETFPSFAAAPHAFAESSMVPSACGDAGSASVVGTAALGRLSGEALAGVTSSASDPQCDVSFGGEAGFTAGYFDTLIVGGAPGASTTVAVTVNLHATPHCSGFGGGGFATLIGSASGRSGRAYSLGINCSIPNPFLTDIILVPATVGDEIHITSLLTIDAQVRGGPPDNLLFDIDALSTATLFADVQDEGFTLTAASGHDYATNAVGVPQPASIGLLTAGLVVVAAGMIRRRWSY